MIKTNRHQERIWAMQLLYSLDLTGDFDTRTARNKILELKEKEMLSDKEYYFEELVKGVLINRAELDKQIREKAINWDIDRIGYLERSILRIALYELQNEIPVGVAINEAVELAKEYIDKKSARFINGILAEHKQEIK